MNPTSGAPIPGSVAIRTMATIGAYSSIEIAANSHTNTAPPPALLASRFQVACTKADARTNARAKPLIPLASPHEGPVRLHRQSLSLADGRGIVANGSGTAGLR